MWSCSHLVFLNVYVCERIRATCLPWFHCTLYSVIVHCTSSLYSVVTHRLTSVKRGRRMGSITASDCLIYVRPEGNTVLIVLELVLTRLNHSQSGGQWHHRSRRTCTIVSVSWTQSKCDSKNLYHCACQLNHSRSRQWHLWIRRTCMTVSVSWIAVEVEDTGFFVFKELLLLCFFRNTVEVEDKVIFEVEELELMLVSRTTIEVVEYGIYEVKELAFLSVIWIINEGEDNDILTVEELVLLSTIRILVELAD